MKLLIVGSDYTWSIERYYLKYLSELNPDTFLFAAQNRLLDYLNQSVFHKIKHKLGLTDIYHTINLELLQTIEDLNPDVLFIFKGMQVLPSTLQYAKQKGIVLVNYNPDNPYLFTGSGSGNKYVTQSLPYYDLFFTYSLEIKAQLEKDFKKPVHFLPFGYDLSGINIDELSDIEEVVRPCFLGNPDKQRASFIKELNQLGIKLDVYGNDWNKFISAKYNQIYPPVYGTEFYKTMRKYRVQLNIMRIHNLASHNMRTFEIPAVGGIQLAPDTPEHRMFFEEGKEIFLYQDVNSCAKKINEMLSISSEKAKIIRASAFSKSKNSAYSYQQRASFVFQILNSL
jgi:hypothetical protein